MWFASSSAADDLLQETFLKAWRARKNFRRESSEKTWLIAIARNVARDHFRKQRPTSGLPEFSSVQSPSYEMRELIETAIKAMSDEKRSCFVLFYKMGFSLREIASLEQVAEGTVKSRLHGARQEFTQFLKKYGVEDG